MFWASRGPFFELLEPLGALLEPFGCLGGVLGAFSLKPLRGSRELSWVPLGSLLGASWELLGALGALLEASWALLEASWELLGASWELSGATWALIDAYWNENVPKAHKKINNIYLVFFSFH